MLKLFMDKLSAPCQKKMMGISFLGKQKILAILQNDSLADNNTLYFCNAMKQNALLIVTKHSLKESYPFITKELPVAKVNRTTSFSKCKYGS